MENISWEDFGRVELRAGTIVRVEEFPEARKPAYKLWADFGDWGIRKSSAQITTHYATEHNQSLENNRVVSFRRKQGGPFLSEFLTTGFVLEDGSVILSQPERHVPNGTRLA
ncbi:MAG: tRNA-binding protein [Gemmataceae bacterium]